MIRSRRINQLVVLIAASWLGAASLYASGITISQSIDRTEVGYDDQVKFDISLEWDGPPSAFLIDGPLRPVLDRLKVASSSSTVSVEGQGESEKTTKLFRFFLEPTSSGVGKIDRIEINYISLGDSIPGMISTDPLEVKIGRPALSSSSDQDSLLWPLYGGIGLALVLAIGGGAFYLRWKKEAKAEPKLSLEQKFLDQLTELKTKSGSDHKQFQTGLYKLLVEYIGERCGLQTKGSSCETIVENLSQSDILLAQRDKISVWLKRAEKEKYSPVGAAPGETTRLESEVRGFFQSIIS